MKYLLVLAVLVVAFYIWRNNRLRDAADRQSERDARTPRKPPLPAAMVACRHCGTHLPETEAIPGRLGPYCSPEHKQRGEHT